MTRERQTLLLTTVNAPYRTYLDGDALALALSTGDIKQGQVNSFFTETTPEDRKAFAEHHGISEAVLAATAKSFARWSGQTLALLAR